MEVYTKEYLKDEFEMRIEDINYQLSDKKCKNKEYLRGKLAAYVDLLNATQGWVKKEILSNFEVVNK